MDEAPDIAAVASLAGEPARAAMLLALMGGRAMTASELSLEADVSPATASAHLSKLTSSRLIQMHKQGRYRYFQITNELVAELVEKLCGVAALTRTPKVMVGPKDLAMRRARVCYDHLAGGLGVRLFESIIEREWLLLRADGIALTDGGAQGFKRFGIDIDSLERARRPMCRQCLDWSERRHHLAGALGAALLSKLFAKRWARRDPSSRAVRFSRAGEEKFAKTFRL